MKKLLTMLLALCMACMMIPAVAEDDITGDWYGLMQGVPVQMTLNADGTFVMIVGGEAYPGQSATWTQDGNAITLVMDGDEQKGTIEDGKMTFAFGDSAVELTRTPAEEIVLAEVNPDATLEDYAGDWNVKYADMKGILVDVIAAGIVEELPGLHVEGNQVTFTGENFISVLFGSEPRELTFEGGALSNTAGTEELSISLKLSLLKDDMLALEISIANESMNMYFIRAIPAEEVPAA